MTSLFPRPPLTRPSKGAIVLAFLALYFSWGTTYFAMRTGVHTYHLPPALFGGTRVCLSGLVLLFYLRLRGESLRLPRWELPGIVLGGFLFFVGGNGFINFAMDHVPSNVAAIMVASTPLWMAMMEVFWPRGDRLAWRGWLGLGLGMAGILLILAPRMENPLAALQDIGPFLVLGSTLSWALGSLVLRHRRKGAQHLTAAAMQMVLGGSGLTLLGLAVGESRDLSAECLAPGAIASFAYLMVIGSLVGFVAFNYLLNHVSAALVGTYAYVNPLVAIVVGWALGGEELTTAIFLGMVVILIGVALVRRNIIPHRERKQLELQDEPKEMIRAPVVQATGSPCHSP